MSALGLVRRSVVRMRSLAGGKPPSPPARSSASRHTQVPLRLWFRSDAATITTQKNGASALGLQRVLGLGSYQTAWPSTDTS